MVMIHRPCPRFSSIGKAKAAMFPRQCILFSRSLRSHYPHLVDSVHNSQQSFGIGAPLAHFQACHLHTNGNSKATTSNSTRSSTNALLRKGASEDDEAHGRRRGSAFDNNERDSRRFISSLERLRQKQEIVAKVLDKAHVKHRIPQKRASKLMNELRQEAKQAPPVKIPDISSGDAVEVKLYESKSAKMYHVARGVVIRKVNKGVDTSLLLRDIVYDIDVEHFIPLYSPLIKSIQVLEKGFIHQGKKRGKRVRQSRIYYLRGIHDKFSRVTGARF